MLLPENREFVRKIEKILPQAIDALCLTGTSIEHIAESHSGGDTEVARRLHAILLSLSGAKMAVEVGTTGGWGGSGGRLVEIQAK